MMRAWQQKISSHWRYERPVGALTVGNDQLFVIKVIIAAVISMSVAK